MRQSRFWSKEYYLCSINDKDDHFKMTEESLHQEEPKCFCAADKERVMITHSGCANEMIDKVYSYLKDLNYFDEILITRAGGVISSHCGPGTLGVLYVGKQKLNFPLFDSIMFGTKVYVTKDMQYFLGGRDYHG